MDKFEQIKNKISEFFSANDIDAEVVKKEEVENKFETVLLADGETEVTIEPAIEMGAAMVISSADGTPVAAPVGEYELQDGRVVVVMEEGVVAEVREAAAEVEEEVLATDAPEEAQKVKRVIERIEKEKQFLEEKVTELEAKFAETESTAKFNKVEGEELLSKFSGLETFVKETLEQVIEIAGGEPSKEPVETKPDPLAAFRAEEGVLESWLKNNNNGE